jgi:hypothetical protein
MNDILQASYDASNLKIVFVQGHYFIGQLFFLTSRRKFVAPVGCQINGQG